MKISFLTLFFTASIFSTSLAQANLVTVDFNSANFIGVNTYTEKGITFRAPNMLTFGTPNETTGIIASGSPRQPIRADIADGASFVSVDLGSFHADSNILFLDIYDSSNNLIGHTGGWMPSLFNGMKTLSIGSSSEVIAYAIFGAKGVNGSSVFSDNFSISAVPELNMFGMLIGGLTVLVFISWYRKNKLQDLSA